MVGLSTSTLEKFKKFIWNLSLSDLNQMEQFPLFRIGGSFESPLIENRETGEYLYENKLYQYVLEDNISAKIYIDQDINAKTYPPEATITYMQQSYVSFQSGQFAIETMQNKVRVIILHLDNHRDYDYIVADMRQCGYFIANTMSYVERGKDWVIYIFEPYVSQNLYNETKNLDYVHITKESNIESIKKNGLIPKHENKQYKYPDRVYLFIANKPKTALKIFARDNGLFQDNRTKVIYIDGNKLGTERRIYGDPFEENAYCTYQPIKPDAFYKICGLLEYSPVIN
jgi:hypothetical protein